MYQEVDAEVVAVEHEPHGVDQERHVAGDEHQHRAGRVPAVAIEVGRQDLYQVLLRPATAPEVEMGSGRRVQVVTATVVGVLVGQLGVVGRKQRTEQPVVGTTLGRQRLQSAQNVGHVVVRSPSSLPCTVASIGWSDRMGR